MNFLPSPNFIHTPVSPNIFSNYFAFTDIQPNESLAAFNQRVAAYFDEKLNTAAIAEPFHKVGLVAAHLDAVEPPSPKILRAVISMLIRECGGEGGSAGEEGYGESLAASVSDLTGGPFNFKFSLILPMVFGDRSDDQKETSPANQKLLQDPSLKFPASIVEQLGIGQNTITFILMLYQTLTITTFCTVFYLLESMDEDIESLSLRA